MLVGLVGRALHPDMADPNQIAVVMLREQLPAMFGSFGVALVAVILVAILAASMSTADSNLHALGGVVTRDIYDRHINPDASERQRAWVGRSVIILTTLFALGVTTLGEHTEIGQGLLQTILQFFFLAMAFSVQLLPAAIDILYVRKGTRAGVVAGMASGAAIVFATFLFASSSLVIGMKLMFDLGFVAVMVNALVFILVSRSTARLDPAHLQGFADDLSQPKDDE
jgi:SSS family solute:Na+ symporter